MQLTETKLATSPFSFYVNGECLYEPSPKQMEFHSAPQKNVLMVGSRGSGKSVALRWEGHARCLATPGLNAIILRRYYPDLEQSHLIYIEAEMEKLGGYYHASSHTAHYPNGSRLRFAHCAEDRHVLVLLGSEYQWMAFDELSTFTWDMFKLLTTSVRAPKKMNVKALVRAATNPFGTSAEDVMHYFVWKDADAQGYDPLDWHHIQINTEDNPHLDLKEYKKQFVGLPEHIRKAWEDGEFVFENALFKFQPKKKIIDYQTKEEREIEYHVISHVDLPKILQASRIYRAYDSGWFPDPSVCLWIAHLGSRYIVFKEQQWWETVASEIAKDILEYEGHLNEVAFGKGWQERGQRLRISATYCDPSIDVNTTADVRTVMDIFAANGVPMEKSINDRTKFAGAIHTMLIEEAMPNVPRLQIYQHGCQFLVKALPQMRYDKNDPDKLADHKMDHWPIALAYFGISSATWARPDASEAPRIRPWMRPKKKVRDPYR